MAQFNIGNFVAINIQRRGEAELQINKRYLTFTKSLIEEMGQPEYIRFLTNAKDSAFALQICKATDKDAYKFYLANGEAKFCCAASVRKSVFALMGEYWDETKFYGCKGTYSAELNATVFDLKNCYIRNVESFRQSKV